MKKIFESYQPHYKLQEEAIPMTFSKEELSRLKKIDKNFVIFNAKGLARWYHKRRENDHRDWFVDDNGVDHNKKGRIYLELEQTPSDEMGDVEKKIFAFFKKQNGEEKKYNITREMYAQGLVEVANAKGKMETIKIGKTLGKINTDESRQLFKEYEIEKGKKGEADLVVISKHPYDILGMTSDRSWVNGSCRRISLGDIHRLKAEQFIKVKTDSPITTGKLNFWKGKESDKDPVTYGGVETKVSHNTHNIKPHSVKLYIRDTLVAWDDGKGKFIAHELANKNWNTESKTWKEIKISVLDKDFDNTIDYSTGEFSLKIIPQEGKETETIKAVFHFVVKNSSKQSFPNETGPQANKLLAEISEWFTAYLIKRGDENIETPVARINIAPYEYAGKYTTDKAGNIPGLPSENLPPIYHVAHTPKPPINENLKKRFIMTIQKWLDKHQTQERQGIYQFPGGSETEAKIGNRFYSSSEFTDEFNYGTVSMASELLPIEPLEKKLGKKLPKKFLGIFSEFIQNKSIKPVRVSAFETDDAMKTMTVTLPSSTYVLALDEEKLKEASEKLIEEKYSKVGLSMFDIESVAANIDVEEFSKKVLEKTSEYANILKNNPAETHKEFENRLEELMGIKENSKVEEGEIFSFGNEKGFFRSIFLPDATAQATTQEFIKLFGKEEFVRVLSQNPKLVNSKKLIKAYLEDSDKSISVLSHVSPEDLDLNRLDDGSLYFRLN